MSSGITITYLISKSGKYVGWAFTPMGVALSEGEDYDDLRKNIMDVTKKLAEFHQSGMRQ